MRRYTYPEEARRFLEGLQQPLGVFQVVDREVVTILVSDGFCRLLGYADRAEAVWDMDNDMYKDAHPDDKKRISDAELSFAASDEAEYEVVFRTKAGADSDYRVIHAHGTHVFPEPGVRLAHIWYMDEGVYVEGDESAGTQMNRELNSGLHEESILRAANYDALTGLPNLNYFFKRSEIRKEKVLDQAKQGCLLYLDLNGMKYYNHSNGFAEGDQLLKGFAECLTQVFGQENCCHVGADRFATSAVEDAAEAKVRQLFELFSRQERKLPVRAGIYSTRLEDVPVSSAYDRAKLACDSIRKSDTSEFSWYTREMSEAQKRRHYIQTNIDRAISEKWIKVYYQAIVRAVSEKVCSEEALARWIDPERGFLSPAEFIPELEESGQIYKLDLYVLEQVLEKITRQQQEGATVVPHSVNLSRSDFESCDIVEEIRKRVDAAGIRRDLITIEITESVIGHNPDFMKKQIERFRQMGFPVWMDDFGSGYSSLDVLQTIQFDLIKFDMGFMRKLDQGDSGKIILTEMMRMATSLGVDTVCEGVETEKQVRFLQEIGCSSLQGFYFSKPIPPEELASLAVSGHPMEYENPAEAEYYENIGRINLYDLRVISSEDDRAFQNAYSTLPMGILEIRGDQAQFIRSSRSFQKCMVRFFGYDVVGEGLDFHTERAGYGPAFLNAVKQCCDGNSRVFFDETMPDGSRAHVFVRKIGENPVTDGVTIVIAVLSIADPGRNDVTEALTRAYDSVWFINDMETQQFELYRVDDDLAHMMPAQMATKITRFSDAFAFYSKLVLEEDRQHFLEAVTPENILRNTEEGRVYSVPFRRVFENGVRQYRVEFARMKLENGKFRIVTGFRVTEGQ